MKTLLITRPLQEASSLAERLKQKGFESFIEPLLTVSTLGENKAALETALEAHPQLLLTTSRRAVDALAQLSSIRAIPLLTVGTATAHYAGSLGFHAVTACETAEMLAGYVTQNYVPANGGLLYIRGEIITTDIAAKLAAESFQVNSVILYRAIPATRLSKQLCREIENGAIAGALFFSQRTSATYAALMQAHGLEKAHTSIHALCMSETVAKPLSLLPWRSLHYADKPDMEHMLAIPEHVFF